jgi:hypothetical protein
MHKLRHLVLLIRPDTILRWHRDLLKRRHASISLLAIRSSALRYATTESEEPIRPEDRDSLVSQTVSRRVEENSQSSARKDAEPRYSPKFQSTTPS